MHLVALATAFATLGAAEVLTGRPDSRVARSFLDAAATGMAPPGDDAAWNGVGDDYGDLRLQMTSACIDAGASATSRSLGSEGAGSTTAGGGGTDSAATSSTGSTGATAESGRGRGTRSRS